MFKTIITSLAVLLFSTTGYTQSKVNGSKNVTTQQFALSDFTAINIGSELEVNFIKSNNPSLNIEADDNLHSAIDYSVNDGILNIQVTKIVRRYKKFNITIRYTDSLQSIMLHDEVKVEPSEELTIDELELTLNDDASIDASLKVGNFKLINNNDSSLKILTNCKLKVECDTASLELREKSNNIIEINCEKLHINTMDNADLKIEGFSYTLDLMANSSSTIEGEKLLTNNAILDIKDKSSLEIQVSDTLNLKASEKSVLTLYGEPKIHIDALQNNATIYKKEL